MRKTATKLLAEYGIVAVIVYFSIALIVFIGAWAAIRVGWTPTSAAGQAGSFAAAYIVMKITQPLRIAATVLLTPLTARAWERATGRRNGSRVVPAEVPEVTPEP